MSNTVAVSIGLLIAVLTLGGCGGGDSDAAEVGGSSQRACERLVDDSGKYEHGSDAWQHRVEECIRSVPPKD